MNTNEKIEGMRRRFQGELHTGFIWAIVGMSNALKRLPDDGWVLFSSNGKAFYTDEDDNIASLTKAKIFVDQEEAEDVDDWCEYDEHFTPMRPRAMKMSDAKIMAFNIFRQHAGYHSQIMEGAGI